jgi:hypothetical protein
MAVGLPVATSQPVAAAGFAGQERADADQVPGMRARVPGLSKRRAQLPVVSGPGESGTEAAEEDVVRDRWRAVRQLMQQGRPRGGDRLRSMRGHAGPPFSRVVPCKSRSLIP